MGKLLFYLTWSSLFLYDYLGGYKCIETMLNLNQIPFMESKIW